MENGNILDYLREDREANPVKLVCHPNSTVFPALLLLQLKDCATGLQYLHNMGLVHGDLQPVCFAPH